MVTLILSLKGRMAPEIDTVQIDNLQSNLVNETQKTEQETDEVSNEIGLQAMSVIDHPISSSASLTILSLLLRNKSNRGRPTTLYVLEMSLIITYTHLHRI
jgi:hypothetical protein